MNSMAEQNMYEALLLETAQVFETHVTYLAHGRRTRAEAEQWYAC